VEYLNFSLLTETDFDEVVLNVGGRRYTDDPDIRELNCDYILEDTVIELKIIEEEPIEKTSKQEKLAVLFRSDIKTVILNPLDLDYYGKRKYYQELASPIKGQLKKASKQLKKSATEVNAQVKIAIIMNNGLTMTTPDEFQRLAFERTKNDTSGIDILIVCGIYYFSDKFDSFTSFEFKDIQIQGEERPELIQKLRVSWFNKVEQYMTKQIVDLNIKRTKEPIQDLFFELDGIRYVKPTIQWGKPSEFFGEAGRPREDSTGMKHCPPVATVLPVFDDVSYAYAKRNIINGAILTNSLREYILWAENERETSINPFQPIVLIPITRQELEMLEHPFSFNQLSKCTLPKFQGVLLSTAENSTEFPSQPISLNYILAQVNEIGMDKANDIAFISHNNDKFSPEQNMIIKGERMKYEYALLLASAHCLSIGADTVYHYRNEDFKWM
jgi:hypothetical protein